MSGKRDRTGRCGVGPRDIAGVSAVENAKRAASSQRLDKWLWFVRLVKTRTRAARLISDSKVRVNQQRVSKPAFSIVEGDIVTSVVNREVRVLKVLSTGARRGPAIEAAELYEDLTPEPVKPENRDPATASPATRAPGAGRPTKRDRRKIDRFRNRN